MERKTVKIRVDMYSDTKFKIIDTMEDRDLINYIWTRLLTLAGKVNLEGELYLSKNIAYTIETLALEFNRSAKKVALALKVFIDLEMVELTKDNIYKVRNFSKHQNIKKKDKDMNKDNLKTVDNEKISVDKYDNTNIISDKEFRNGESEKAKDFIVSEGEKSNMGNLMVNNNVEKFKKDNAVNIIDFNSSNKINDCINSEGQDNNIKDNTKTKSNEILDKKTLNKSEDINYVGVLKNKVYIVNKEDNKKFEVNDDKKTENKDILENEFVFSKAKCKKKKTNSKSKKKEKDVDEIICDLEDECEEAEICEFTDEPPKGNVIATFEF